ncbi:MAG TPA: DNA repair protein RecO [Candidatus Megaira endosymbiont of Hartmannula sinica]|nr:DNA repair protein RecO [Candidatus Megaera endosymbiont of Hartmannula sinica]
MQIEDVGILLEKKFFRDDSDIITIFSRYHGLCSGIYKSRKKSLGGIIEGDLVSFTKKARLSTHLGLIKCESIKPYGYAILNDKYQLYAFKAIASLIKSSFCETENNDHKEFFDDLERFLELNINDICSVDKDKFIYLIKLFLQYILLEISLLKTHGFKLSLDKCVVNNNNYNLYYVSPKSACAVSREAGSSYHDKMLIYPKILQSFILETNKTTNQSNNYSKKFCYEDISKQNIYDSAALTLFFLKKNSLISQSKNSFDRSYNILNERNIFIDMVISSLT